MTKSLSEQLFETAEGLLPGGVNSPVRAFRAVGGVPRFIDRAEGSRIYDIDGREYIDYVGSWGPMILGHSHPQVVEAIRKAVERGTSYGAPTPGEIALARTIIEAFPSMEMIRMVSSGTEAVMSAIRLARGFTGRDKILKFEGCYHGHGDSLLVKAGSGVATLGIPGSPGVPACLAELTITVPFNSTEAFRKAVDRHGKELACVIVEPVAANMGVVNPRPGFLETLRELTRKAGIVLIFDEVITGFRLTYGGFQKLCRLEPDLTCLGKIIGGGLPVGAFGGKRTIMDFLAPNRPRLPGGHPLRQSPGHVGRAGHPGNAAQPEGRLRRFGQAYGGPLRRHGKTLQDRGASCTHQPGRLPVHGVLYGFRCIRLRNSLSLQLGTVCPLLQGHAGSGRLSCAVRFRSGLCFLCPFR